MESGGRPSLGQFIFLGTSSVVTAVLYSVYRQKAQVAQELKVSRWSPGGLCRVVSAPGFRFRGHPGFASGRSTFGKFSWRRRNRRRELSPCQDSEELVSSDRNSGLETSPFLRRHSLFFFCLGEI